MKQKAFDLVNDLFKDKTDKAGLDYRFHLLRVYQRVKDKTNNEDVQIAALLHDVIEDTELGYSDLVEMFNKHIADLVWFYLTRKEDQSYMDYIKLISRNQNATLIKLCDLEDNLDLSRLDVINEEDLKRNKKYEKAHKYLKSLS